MFYRNIDEGKVISQEEISSGIFSLLVENKGANFASPGQFVGVYPLLANLGNGFPVDEVKGKCIVLMGGGIGIPPMLGVAKALKGEDVHAFMGYRNKDLFLHDDFLPHCKVYIATEDGSVGVKGNVLDALRASTAIKPDVIMACGPMPMLRAIKKYAEENDIIAYISLEERMACGVGACLGCVCKTVKKDDHSHVNNTRICTEGPVFDAREVDI